MANTALLDRRSPMSDPTVDGDRAGDTSRAGWRPELLHAQAAVLNMMEGAVNIIDERGTIVYSNPANDDLFGYLPGELVGRSVSLLYPAGASGDWLLLDGEPLWERRDPWRGEQTLVRQDGTRLHSRSHIQVVSDGHHLYSVAVLHDVTEEHQQRNALAAALSGARAILWSAVVEDRSGELLWDLRIVDEDAAQQLLPLDLAPGQRYIDAWIQSSLPEERVRMDRTSTDAIRSGAPGYWQEFRIRSRDQETRWLAEDVRILPMGAGWWRLVGVCTDITAPKQHEDEIRRLNEQLERRVEERTAELGRVNREMESFTYSLAHDLQAPLRGINGYANLLLGECGDRLEATERGYLRRIGSAARHMGQLMDGLLLLARLSRHTLQTTALDLGEMVRRVVALLESCDEGRGPEVIVQDPLPAHGDPFLLRIALQNLLENAWKYSRLQRRPVITFGSCEQDGQMVYFVRDNGIGFDMRYVDKLFGAFQRLHAESEFEGRGIGLALVQHTIERHGGRVWAEAEPGCGATFFFTLNPASIAPTEREEPL